MVKNMIKWILVGVGLAIFLVQSFATMAGSFVASVGVTVPLTFVAAGLIVIGAWMD